MADYDIKITEKMYSTSTGELVGLWIDCSKKVHAHIWLNGSTGNMVQSEFYSKATGRIVAPSLKVWANVFELVEARKEGKEHG